MNKGGPAGTLDKACDRLLRNTAVKYSMEVRSLMCPDVLMASVLLTMESVYVTKLSGGGRVRHRQQTSASGSCMWEHFRSSELCQSWSLALFYWV